jgi:cell division transport system ATP-binding protein
MGGAREGSSPGQFIVEMKDVDREFAITRDPQTGVSQTNLSKIHALSRVSLKLRPGEFVFLTGPSGAGKTTLLRILLGLDNPTSGEIFTLGKPMNKLSESQRRELRKNIGVIFQDHRLLNSFNVFENIELPLQLLGISQKERHRRVLEILEVVQMKDHAFESVQSLSAGEKQRIGIARSLVSCPSLIVADEPTGNLDPVAARSLIRMLKELKGHGTTIFIATHDMGLVRDFGGRVLELVGGSVPPSDNARDSKAYKIPKFWNPTMVNI